MQQEEVQPQETVEQLREMLAASEAQAVDAFLNERDTSESALVVTRLTEQEQVQLLSLVPQENAAELIEALPESEAAQLVSRLEPADAASILDRVESDRQADVIGLLPDDEAETILQQMAPSEAAHARELLQYPPDTAGGLMVTEHLAYVESLRVEDVLADLRCGAERYRRYDVQYAYVVTARGTLCGVLRLRDLLLSSSDERLASLMIHRPLKVKVDDSLEELERFFDNHPLFGVPVVDEEDRLVGVVRRHDIEEAAADRSSRSFLKFMGIHGGEELRTMPLARRSFGRLSWLSVNIILNIVAASVIAVHQDTLSAVIALAVFLPIISDMSGCSGNQAVAVTMRELTLGMLKPVEFLRVISKEAAVGIVNGTLLGVLLGAVAYLWKGNTMLGLVVAAALAANTLVAVCIGGTVPLILRAMKQDPALASGPILTTVTDMCGFFLVLSLAAASLPLLTA